MSFHIGDEVRVTADLWDDGVQRVGLVVAIADTNVAGLGPIRVSDTYDVFHCSWSAWCHEHELALEVPGASSASTERGATSAENEALRRSAAHPASTSPEATDAR